MVTQEQEASATASYVKRIVEEETGEKYVLKGRAELVHPDGLSWFLHLPIGKAGWLSHAQQEGGSLVFESGYLYDANTVIEYEYRSALKNGTLKSDLSKFDLKEVRAKYSRTVPKVVKFFDMAEKAISTMNESHHTKMSLANPEGLIRVSTEIDAKQAQENEMLVRENLRAMKELVNQVTRWLEQERKKSIHMAQIKKTHHKLMAETRPTN